MATRTDRYFGLFKTPAHMTEVLSRPIIVVGCGSIGRRLLLLLAQTGFTNLTFFDDDKVSEENMGPQGYNPDDVGATKVECMAADLDEIFGFPDDDSYVYAHRKVLDDDISGASVDAVVFNCTDSMECRKQLSDLCAKYKLPLFDGRMSISTFQVLWKVPGLDASEFDRSLFPSSEAEPTPCTLKASSWCASTCASIMLGVLMNYLIMDTLPSSFVQGSLMPFPSIAEVPNLH